MASNVVQTMLYASMAVFKKSKKAYTATVLWTQGRQLSTAIGITLPYLVLGR